MKGVLTALNRFHIRVRACALIIENNKVLLVEFNDEHGVHYNLPAGGAEPGETIKEAVVREAREEAGVEVEVGPLVFVLEVAPHLMPVETHTLSLMFDCTIKPGSIPHLPSQPDPNQSGVRWVALDELDEIKLYPPIQAEIRRYARERNPKLDLMERHLLDQD